MITVLKMKKVTARLIYMYFVQLAEGQLMFFQLYGINHCILLTALFYIQGEF